MSTAMQHAIMILLACSPLCGATAQVWGVQGAHWTYGWYTNQGFGYVDVNYTGDTIIAGTTAQKMDVVAYDPAGTIVEDHYTRTEENLVQIWDGSAFDTLYWYAAVPGDHWQVPLTLQWDAVVTVIDTGTISMQSVPVHYLTVEYEPGFPQNDTLFQRIGSRTVFPSSGWTLGLDAPVAGVWCYEDPEIHYSSGLSPTCTIDVGIHEVAGGSGVVLQPDVGGNRLMVSAKDGSMIDHVLVLDAIGRVCVAQRVGSSTAGVDTHTLSTGCYSVIVHGVRGTQGATRWIKP